MERVVVRREKLRAWIFLFLSVAFAYYGRITLAVRSEKEIRARFYGNLVNSSAPDTNDGTIAKMFDRVLEKEFSENDQPEGMVFPFSFFFFFGIGFCIFVDYKLSWFIFGANIEN